MKRATILATILVNGGHAETIEHGRHRVQAAFNAEFPKDDFRKFDTEVSDSAAHNYIERAGKPGRILIRNALLELKELR